jgi:hypothetical protein
VGFDVVLKVQVVMLMRRRDREIRNPKKLDELSRRGAMHQRR